MKNTTTRKLNMEWKKYMKEIQEIERKEYEEKYDMGEYSETYNYFMNKE